MHMIAFFGVKITIPTDPNIYLQETGWDVNRMGPGKMIQGQASFVDRMGANLYMCTASFWMFSLYTNFHGPRNQAFFEHYWVTQCYTMLHSVPLLFQRAV